jgi:diguanylate cyclase (GGDEF)-like protein
VSDKSAASTLAEELAKLRNDYMQRLPAELAALQELASNLHGNESDRANLTELHHRLHKLAGAPSAFNIAALSASARTLEQQTKSWLAFPLDQTDAQTRQAYINNIAALSTGSAEISPPALTSTPARSLPVSAPGDTINIWLVEDDTQLADELVHQLESFGYVVSWFTRLLDAETRAQTEQPDLLIMDVILDQEQANTTEVLSQQPYPLALTCPLLFISSVDDFPSRVRAAQLGAEGYFLKPLDIPRLANRLAQVLEQRRAPPQRVLIVDDDRDIAAHYRLVLMDAGMEVDVLHQPDAVIEKIAAFHPELVLMDLYMPGYSGPELAGVIRQYDKWTGLPIVYLSAETDVDLQVAAMSRGADDFLTKPVADVQLVAAVRSRIDRARQLAEQIAKDSLTGLLKHARIKEVAEIEVIRSRRIGKPVTLAMLDIDHFKKVNDNYGHAVGDIVISSVAMLLRQRLRHSDIVGRYGGEEFIAVLPECDTESALQLMNDIRQRFAEVHFKHAEQTFTCSLSVGLACSARHPNANAAELLIAADQAMYAAKRGGRNQVRSFSPGQDS